MRAREGVKFTLRDDRYLVGRKLVVDLRVRDGDGGGGDDALLGGVGEAGGELLDEVAVPVDVDLDARGRLDARRRGDAHEVDVAELAGEEGRVREEGAGREGDRVAGHLVAAEGLAVAVEPVDAVDRDAELRRQHDLRRVARLRDGHAQREVDAADATLAHDHGRRVARDRDVGRRHDVRRSDLQREVRARVARACARVVGRNVEVPRRLRRRRVHDLTDVEGELRRQVRRGQLRDVQVGGSVRRHRKVLARERRVRSLAEGEEGER